MKVQDCMTNGVVWVNPSTNIHDAAKLMDDNNIGCMPVCDTAGKIVGILTDRDIILRGIASDKNAQTTPVSDIMTTKVVKTTPDAEINDVAFIMAKNQIRRIPVVLDEKVVGIVSLENLVQNTNIGKENISDTLCGIFDYRGKNTKHDA